MIYWDTSKNGVVEGYDSYNKRSTNKSEEFFLKSYFKIVKWKVRVSFQFHFISRFLGPFHEMQQLYLFLFYDTLLLSEALIYLGMVSPVKTVSSVVASSSRPSPTSRAKFFREKFFQWGLIADSKNRPDFSFLSLSWKFSPSRPWKSDCGTADLGREELHTLSWVEGCTP